MRLALPGKRDGVAAILMEDTTVTIRLPDGKNQLDGRVWEASPVPRQGPPFSKDLTLLHRLGMPIGEGGPKGAYVIVLVTMDAVPVLVNAVPLQVEVLVRQGTTQRVPAEALATAWGLATSGEEFNIPLVGVVDLASNPDVCAAIHFGMKPPHGEAALLLHMPEYVEPTGENPGDDLYEAVVRLCTHRGKASTSLVQRAFSIGYNRAARIIEAAQVNGDLS